VLTAIRECNRVGSGAVIGQANGRPLFGVARRIDHSLALEWLPHVDADAGF
jgi:hypothetical protein